VWLSPLQEVSDFKFKRGRGLNARKVIPIDAEVLGSLYASKSLDRLNKEFIRYSEDDSEEEIQRKGDEQLTALVDEIKARNMIPMFDLVLNHVAADSELIMRYPDFFCKTADSYLDAHDFNYEEMQDDIIEKIWKPFIEKYAKKYHFEGARIDAPFLFALKNITEARKKIYRIMHENIENPIMFEELLFDGYDVKKIVSDSRLDRDFPTHFMSSLSFLDFLDGPIESRSRFILQEYRDEISVKEATVFNTSDGTKRDWQGGGAVNVVGSHDQYSLLGETLINVCDDQLRYNDELKRLAFIYQKISAKINALAESGGQREVLMLRMARDKIQFGIIKELSNHFEKFSITRENLEFFLRERMAIVALTGGGGFFMTSGDESGDIRDKAVFMPIVASAGYSPEIEYSTYCEILQKYANCSSKEYSELEKSIIRNGKDLISQESEFCNFGIGPHQGNFDLREFTREINIILSRMPPGRAGHQAEILMLSGRPELLIVMRTNGSSFKIEEGQDPISRGDLIIMNLSPEKVARIDDKDLKEIYLYFEGIVGRPYDGSYNHIHKANLHLSSGITNASSKVANVAISSAKATPLQGKSLELFAL